MDRNELEYRMAELFSALYSVKELLKENHLTDSTTTTILNLLEKDRECLENYLREKGVIYNGKEWKQELWVHS